jgi:hypothetical protein
VVFARELIETRALLGAGLGPEPRGQHARGEEYEHASSDGHQSAVIIAVIIARVPEPANGPGFGDPGAGESQPGLLAGNPRRWPS